MDDDKKVVAKKEEEKAIEAPISEICGEASANAAAEVDDESEIKPVEGFFFTSQRWH